MSFWSTINFLWFGVLISLIVSVLIPTSTNADSFYGMEALNPMVRGDEMIVHLPGKAEFTIKSNEKEYFLTDHLGSHRLSVVRNNTISEPIDYTPFGDIPSDSLATIGHYYAGMLFEPGSATYNNHARWYDPSFSRFGSLDALRESISPYSYTDNNPINFVDPTGLIKVNFLFYSSLDATGTKSPRKIETFKEIDKALQYAVAKSDDKTLMMVSDLSSHGPDDFPVFKSDTKHEAKIGNITITSIGLLVSRQREIMGGDKGGELLADQLYERLEIEDSGFIRERLEGGSIFLPTCGLACHEESYRKSFAAEFAFKIKDYFPGLKYVTASPYNISPRVKKDGTFFTDLEISKIGSDGSLLFGLRVPVEQYATGDFGPNFFVPPTADMFSYVKKSGEKSTQRADIAKFFSESNFREPIFYRMPLRRPLPPEAAVAGSKSPSEPHLHFEF